MNARILNRNFEHPADSWYQIEPKGEHPNRASSIVQVIDDAACQAIVNRFNADADAGTLSHGHEMLIDHEHFKHQADKETTAYGWLQRVQNRADGIYGQIRWSGTGQKAVDSGDYRFFSTEYDPADLKILNADKKVKRVRPLKLDGLTLTNDPNNKGGKPITNRQGAEAQCPDCGGQMKPVAGSDEQNCPACKKNFPRAGQSGTDNFAGSRESADSTTANQPIKNTKMKTVCTLLGLSADADESSVHTAVTKLQNRVTELTPLAEENKTLLNRLQAVDSESVDSLLALHGVKEEKVLNRLKPVIASLKTREDRVATLTDLGYVPGAAKPAVAPASRVLNRSNVVAADPASAAAAGNDEQAKVEKIRNRCSELTKSGLKFDAAWAMAVAEANK